MDASNTLSCCHRYSNNVLKHFSSNGWFSLYHIIPIARLRGVPKSDIVVAFPGRILPNLTYYGLSHASRSFLLQAYIQMECFAALQKQWMTLLATYRPIFQAMSGPQIRHFTGFLVTISDGYGLVCHTRGT